MKKYTFLSALLFFVLVHLFHESSFGEIGSEPCLIKGNVTWEYNQYVGTKPDIGAKVILFRRINHQPKLNPSALETDKKQGVYVTQVNALGQFEINKLPPGMYDLIVVSKATKRKLIDTSNLEQYRKNVDINNLGSLENRVEEGNYRLFERAILSRHFSKEDWKKAELYILSRNKYDTIGEIKLSPGDEKEINVDFGNTYY